MNDYSTVKIVCIDCIDLRIVICMMMKMMAYNNKNLYCNNNCSKVVFAPLCEHIGHKRIIRVGLNEGLHKADTEKHSFTHTASS